MSPSLDAFPRSGEQCYPVARDASQKRSFLIICEEIYIYIYIYIYTCIYTYKVSVTRIDEAWHVIVKKGRFRSHNFSSGEF